MRLSEAIPKFNENRKLRVKEINGYDLDLRQLCIFLRDCDIEDVAIEHINEWLNRHRLLGFETSTIIKKELALRKFFEYFKKQGYDVLDFSLIPLSKREFVIPRVADEQNYRKLLSVIPEKSNYYFDIRNKCILNIIWETGMRLGECVSLNVSDLDFKERAIIIRTEKSRGMRPFRKIPWRGETDCSLPLWLRAREKTIENIELEDPEALFIAIKGGFKGKGARGKRLAKCAAGEVFRKLSNKAGLPYYVNAHSFRHHMGHEMAKRGLPNSIISEALGHSSLASSFQYSFINSVDLIKQLRKVFRK